MIIPQPISVTRDHPDFAAQLAAIPASPGIYQLVISGAAPHLGSSANLARRVRRIFASGALSSRASSAASPLPLEKVLVWTTGSRLESSLLLYSLARQLFPDDYERRLRLRLPWFVAVYDSDGFPRLAVVNRKRRYTGSLWGPFPTRDAAEYYIEEVLRLHQIRRCTEPLRPSPDHPGCIYGEMNQCIRPCQCAVSSQEYAAEFSRLTDFLSSNGKTVLSTLTSTRALASQNMEFEQAALIHKRIEQVKTAVAARGDIVSELPHFHGIAVTRGRSEGEVCLWPMLASIWQPPIALNVSAQQAEAKSLDLELKERLTHAASDPSSAGDPLEHLAVFLRWYGSSWRDGAWVGFSSLPALNYRRLVREISKLAKQSDPPRPPGE